MCLNIRIYYVIIIILGTMVIVMFLLNILHNGLAITAYDEAEKQFLTKLGKINSIKQFYSWNIFDFIGLISF